MTRKEVGETVLILNSTGPMDFKYPFGNEELTKEVKTLEEAGKIHFNKFKRLWALGGAK